MAALCCVGRLKYLVQGNGRNGRSGRSCRQVWRVVEIDGSGVEWWKLCRVVGVSGSGGMEMWKWQAGMECGGGGMEVCRVMGAAGSGGEGDTGRDCVGVVFESSGIDEGGCGGTGPIVGSEVVGMVGSGLKWWVW